MDFPGFGLSEGLHGYIPSFDKLVDDVIEQYSKIKGIYNRCFINQTEDQTCESSES